MATQEVLQDYGTQLLFADHATDFGAAPATPANSLIIGSPTDVQMNVSVLAAAAAWESAKTASLAKTGTAFPIDWVLGVCMESAASVTGGGTYDFYWNGSPSATAGTGNSGEASGTDLAFAIAGLTQLIFIGSLTVIDASVIHIDANVGVLRMPYLYGSLIIVNNTDVAMVDAVADEIHFTLTPIITDIQASA